MASIEIRTIPLGAAPSYRHAFFIFTKDDGTEYVVRAGPGAVPQFTFSETVANITSQAFGIGDERRKWGHSTFPGPFPSAAARAGAGSPHGRTYLWNFPMFRAPVLRSSAGAGYG